MKDFRKFLSASLAAVMVMGSSSAIFAGEYEDVKNDHPAKTEISFLSDIGVIKGTEEGIFSPELNVSREQMATLLFRLMLGRDDAGKVNTTSFTDLYDPFYNGAISWAHSAGYIKGTSSTSFEPKGGITKQDAMTMLVRALGQDNGKMNEGYPWSYINAAIKLGLDNGLEDVGYEETLTRGETATMLFNALTTEYIIARTTVNGNIYYESTSIIEEVFGYSIADAVLVATNNYSIIGETVTKNGYVTLRANADGEDIMMTVPATQLGLGDNLDSMIGQSFKLIYNYESGKYTVLSAVGKSETESFDSVTVGTDGKVTIGEEKYTIVGEYSDELSTNNNELKVYAYDADGTLSQITSSSALRELLGFYNITLIKSEGEEIAKTALIRSYEMGVLKIENDKINLAGNKNISDLTVIGKDKAENGDHVLFYYNAPAGEIEIFEVLEVVMGTVKRITGSTAKIGEESYVLGNETAGISASSIRNKLVLGVEQAVVLHQGRIVSVIEGVTISDESNYLVALSDAHRVYENGSFRYVMTAFIDGAEKNIYVNDSSAAEGNVYRYTETAGEYTLIAPKDEDGIIISGKTEFIQSNDGLDEIAHIIGSADGTTIELGGRNFYTLDKGNAGVLSSVAGLESVNFVSDKDTEIVVIDDGVVMKRKGIYNSTITVNDGARVVAIFDNEVGSVETLKFLFISDGQLGNYNLDADFVRVLASNGLVYENGRAYVEYTVFNFATNTIESKLSLSGELIVGNDYRCGADGTITSDSADVVLDGFVTGHTASTVTVDGTTLTLAADVKIIRITSANQIANVTLADLYMRNVEFVADGGEVKLIIESDAPKFEAAVDGNVITVTPDFDLTNFSASDITVVSLAKGEESISVEGAVIAFGEDNTVTVTLGEGVELTEGVYKLSFKVTSKAFEVSFTVEVAE